MRHNFLYNRLFCRHGALLGGAALAIITLPAVAQDVSEGTVIAYDRVAKVLVLKDKTVWPLEKLSGSAPEDLKAGDRVEIKYESNEDDGITAIHSIELSSQ